MVWVQPGESKAATSLGCSSNAAGLLVPGRAASFLLGLSQRGWHRCTVGVSHCRAWLKLLAKGPGQRSSGQPGSRLTELQTGKQGGDSCTPWDVSLTGRSAPKPCSGTPAAEEHPACSAWPCSSSVGPSWEQRVGSFVSSTRLSIRPRPLGPEKSGGEESHGGRRQMPAERKTRASVLWCGPRMGGSISRVTAVPWQGGCEQHSPTSELVGRADGRHVLGTLP